MIGKRVIKILRDFSVRPFVDWYYKSPRNFVFQSVHVPVFPTVYRPNFNGTTKALLNYLSTLEINGKTVLDLGTGSGAIAAFCAEKGALVTATDIQEDVVVQVANLAREQELNIISVYSNLFENLDFTFDYICINPPFVNKPVTHTTQYGLHCGRNFQYFEQLFKQIRIRDISKTKVIMVLPEEAEMFAICFRAKKYRLEMKTVKIVHQGLDTSYIYQIQKND